MGCVFVASAFYVHIGTCINTGYVDCNDIAICCPLRIKPAVFLITLYITYEQNRFICTGPHTLEQCDTECCYITAIYPCNTTCELLSDKFVSPWRATELTGIRRVITDEMGNKSHMSITFIQHSLKRHSSFCPTGSLRNTAIVKLSDGYTLRIAVDVIFAVN